MIARQSARLLVGALRRRRAVGRDRRRAGDVHAVAPATTARENPATRLVRRVARSAGVPWRPALVSRPWRRCARSTRWDVPFAAAGVTRAGRRRSRPAATRAVAVRLASVSKPVTALATLVAAEEGVVDLDEPAGPPGSTVRHLLAHASGLPFEGEVADRAARAAPHLLERGLRASLGEHVARAGRDAVRRLRARGRRASRSGSRSTRRAIPAPGMHALPRRRARARARAARARARRAGDARRDGDASSSRASTACCPTSAASARSTGGSASSSRATKEGALVGHADVAADVRPLRRQRHVPLGRSRAAASPAPR